MNLKIGFAATVLSLLCLSLAGCAPGQSFDSRLDSIAKPYRFSIVKWEAETIPHQICQQVSTGYKVEDEVGLVVEYFSAIRRIKTLEAQIRAVSTGNRQSDLASLEAELGALLGYKTETKDTVERILEKQIKQTLAQQGIFNPLDRYLTRGNFPPLNFKLEPPPHLLVVSPRDRIVSIRRVYLAQDLSLKEKEAIEAEVDELGVSSLVVELGGLAATYPSFVADDLDLDSTIDAAAEEWIHQYLAFKPLGFLYLLDQLGIAIDYEVITMNETTASIASEEIGDIVMERFYPEQVENENNAEGTGFDFNAEMRQIRLTVDDYLSEGEIEQAEQYMEEKRQYIIENGYYIRKLNQAYFAFHGTYADEPTSVDPIGKELKELRSRSASLKEFLYRAGALTSREGLRRSIE